MFVFRDKTKTPLKRLIETWEEDLHQMWASITKPAAYEDMSFTDLFQACPPFCLPQARICLAQAADACHCINMLALSAWQVLEPQRTEC